MRKGALLKFDYTARLEDGSVIDTTVKEIGEKNGMKAPFSPMTVLLGEDKVLKGLEEALLEMKEGEEKKFTMPPEKAFGKREPGLVKIIPVAQFRAQGMNPYPGLTFTVEEMKGKVQSVSGGRVRVDFNSEFAGQTLDYTVKVLKEAKSDKEKAAFLFERVFGFEPSVDVSDSAVTYSVESFSPQRKKLAEDVKTILGKKTTSFVEKVEPSEKKEKK
jgi:FKBP-type peptidyl-prolyl cis-trans isomerase 2